MLLIGSMYCNKAGAKEIDRRIQYRKFKNNGGYIYEKNIIKYYS